MPRRSGRAASKSARAAASEEESWQPDAEDDDEWTDQPSAGSGRAPHHRSRRAPGRNDKGSPGGGGGPAGPGAFGPMGGGGLSAGARSAVVAGTHGVALPLAAAGRDAGSAGAPSQAVDGRAGSGGGAALPPPVALLTDAPEIWYTSIRVGAGKTLSSDPCQFVVEMSEPFVAALMLGSPAHARSAGPEPRCNPAPHELGHALSTSGALTAEMLYFDGRLPTVYCQDRDELTSLRPPVVQVDALSWCAERGNFRATVGVQRRLAPLSSSHGDQPFVLAFRFALNPFPVVVCRTRAFLVLRKQSASASALKKVHPNPFVPLGRDRAAPLLDIQRGVLRPMRQGFSVSSRVLSGSVIAAVNPSVSVEDADDDDDDAGAQAAAAAGDGPAQRDGAGHRSDKRQRDDGGAAPLTPLMPLAGGSVVPESFPVGPADVATAPHSLHPADGAYMPLSALANAAAAAQPRPAKRARAAAGHAPSPIELGPGPALAGPAAAMAAAAVAEAESELAAEAAAGAAQAAFGAQSPGQGDAASLRSAIVFEAPSPHKRRHSGGFVTPLLPMRYFPSPAGVRPAAGSRASARGSTPRSRPSPSGVPTPDAGPSPSAWLAAFLERPVARRLAAMDAIPGLLDAMRADLHDDLLQGPDAAAAVPGTPGPDATPRLDLPLAAAAE